MREKNLINKILLRLSGMGTVLFRNNVGLAWMGRTWRPNGIRNVQVCPRDVVVFDAMPVKYGVGGNGGSDLIGWHPIKITEDMVGHTIAVIAAFEIKTNKVPVTKQQKQFIDNVNNAGGIGVIAYSEHDAVMGLTGIQTGADPS